MDRRAFVTVVGGSIFATLRPAEAQQPETVARIGVLLFGSPAPFREGFRQAMLDQGYMQGRNLVVEYRWAGGRADRLAELAAELVQLRVDVIVASATPSIQAAIAATGTIPIVMAAAGDALGTRLVAISPVQAAMSQVCRWRSSNSPRRPSSFCGKRCPESSKLPVSSIPRTHCIAGSLARWRTRRGASASSFARCS